MDISIEAEYRELSISRSIFEIIIIAKVAYCRTRMFITIFTTARM